MVNWLHSKQEERIWTTGHPGEGVVLKQTKGRYVCCPSELQDDDSQFYQSVSSLNVRITSGLRLQVVPSLRELPYCQKHQSAAFIQEEQLLVVWEDDPKRLLERATFIESMLMQRVWGQDPAVPGSNDQKGAFATVTRAGEDDTEVAAEKPRRLVLNQSVLTAATLTLVLSAIGSGWRNIAIELLVDRNWIRMGFLACLFPQIWLALFFFQALVGNFAQLLGPIGQVRENTKYYSGQPPRRLQRDAGTGLPHVTIQMPVYKEGLHAVIEPTIRSVKAAISTYELQGGTANIFVNDDGMQLIPSAQARARQDFYDEHNIGWVARPKHNPKPAEGERKFVRAGKFKKASNMNYALGASIEVEAKMADAHRTDDWNQRNENELYSAVLSEVIQAREGEMWADGNIRVGDYILLIDSDTRVPTDCLLDAVSEMEQSPQVAIIQYASGVMNVTESFFEKGITFFTNLIYTQIQYAVANGDVAPFVGHNAVVRWSAMQDIAYDCPIDKREKFWSEKTVSEDFDMSLRLQTNGYVVRFGAYKDKGFKEGVSLTVYDELARWEKYAYGCNELIFHPLRHWLSKGPFTNLFRRFIFSSMPLPSKVTILAYIGTYYALGSAWILTLMNYFLVGWYNGMVDQYYIDSFKVYFSIVVVFTAMGNVSLAVLRYRIGEKSLIASLWENLTWVPLLVFFLGGVSIHVSQALVCHMFSIEMSWGATAKEVDNVTFFEEIPRVIKKFKWTFLFCIACAAMMVVLATVVHPLWRITSFTPIWSLSCVVVMHFLVPIVLNPNLMLFTW
ncbi:hypothetical protein BU24DRAFT_366132 [Aaosphaeria arxii CBS 175.79]|uniref:Uncharacterized protein n=1 Tax=Aaosphaeria arxii CBS 175.79 TaxID=1450172 RepID=A0A6A5Y403_9PLEO|nr:uncharacterized protein BU24DRAFT_366132 [Aaosphaeria arxii CBS 175.79]KAF2020282.1 hypothetical protein BU24DRAFT_366132 [Aaosphaeria arxii CBS 175.79]